jgi:hypothetical protein
MPIDLRKLKIVKHNVLWTIKDVSCIYKLMDEG